jgi:hypothetical protein
MAPLCFFPGGDQAAFPEYLHMVRQRRLTDLQLFQQVTAALFALGQHLHDLQPVGIRQGFADLRDYD